MANIRQRKTLKGEKRYQAFIRIKGYKPLMKTFDKYSKAQEWAQKIEVQMRDGVYKEVSEELEKRLNTKFNLMEDLINYFKENIAPTRYSYAEKYNCMFDWWIEQIGSVRIIDLSAAMLASCKQILASEKILKKNGEVVRSNNTINKYLMCISAVLTYAVRELEIIDINPMSKINIMPKPQGRTRFLSMEEIRMFIDACKSHSKYLYVFVLISISTGARYSEVLTLAVENFDFVNNQVHYLDTKNKENRGVPIDSGVLGVVKEYLEENSIVKGLIFLNPTTGKLRYIRGCLQKIIENLGLKDFRPHDIRHTTASYIAMNGGSLLDIAEILGHKSLVMARRYSHLTDKHTAKVLNKVTSKILPEL